MSVEIRTRPSSIRAALLHFRDPLRILRIINHVPGWSECQITLTKPEPHKTLLVFSFAGSEMEEAHVYRCLDGIVPEVFDCDRITISFRQSVSVLDDPRRFFRLDDAPLVLDLKRSSSDSKHTRLEVGFENLSRDFVLPGLQDPPQVVERLLSDTVMDSGDPALGERSVELRLLSSRAHRIERIGFHKRTVRKCTLMSLPVKRTTDTLNRGEVRLDLLTWITENPETQRRMQFYVGSVPAGLPEDWQDSELFRHLLGKVDDQSARHLGISLEVSTGPEYLEYDLLHRVVPDDRFLALLEDVGKWLQEAASRPEVQEILARASARRDAQIAERLHERQLRVGRGPFVCLKGQPILQVPRSEKDVLALYFKLEGFAALPLAGCRVLEHTASRDTDAIGHFQIGPGDAPKRFALIEFEYQFSKFLSHGHSIRHVDLVICWTASTRDPLIDRADPWLKLYRDPHMAISIPVLILDSIPNVEVRHA